MSSEQMFSKLADGLFDGTFNDIFLGHVGPSDHRLEDGQTTKRMIAEMSLSRQLKLRQVQVGPAE